MNSNDLHTNVPTGLNAFGEWINEVFRLWSANISVWILQGLIVFCITVLPGLILDISQITDIVQIIQSRGATPPAKDFSPVEFVVSIVSVILSFMLTPGMIHTALKQLRGEPITVADLFGGIRFGWGVFVTALAISLGLLACCIGAFATNGLFFLAVPLMIAQKAPTMKALKVSWRTVSKNFWLYVLFALVMGLLSSAGMVLCYVGVIVTIPFLSIAQAVAYVRTFENQPSMLPPAISGTMPPPYLPTEQHTAQPTEESTVTPPLKTCPLCGARIPENFSICPQCHQVQD